MTVEPLLVRYIPDGDTLRCRRPADPTGAEIRLRLAYLDAPELDHPAMRPYAVRARAYLRRLLYAGELIEARLYGQDAYGRLLAEVIVRRDGAHCGLRLVQGGYAALWQCPRRRGEYYAAQAEAQRQRRGIWAAPGPWQTPWRYRGDRS